MPQSSTIDKFFGAMDDAYDVLMDTLKTATDRGHRVSKEIIEQVQQGQQDTIKMAHSIATSPTDLGKASGAIVERLTKTQGRVLVLSRQWLDETLDSQQEGREALRRLIEANREAGQAAIEASRDVLGRAQDRARDVVRPSRGGNSAKATGTTRARRKAQADEPKTG